MEKELDIENKFIKKLQDLGYESINILDINGIKANLKKQIENLNNIEFSDKEFKEFYSWLIDKTNVINIAKKLRMDKFSLKREIGNNKDIILFDKSNLKNNTFQVANQIKNNNSSHDNRYDVTILLNGLPIVQIELKKPLVNLKQAINQINRYKNETMNNSIFAYIQLFIVSNKNETLYLANNNMIKKIFAFKYAKSNNYIINNLFEFADTFLPKDHLFKMIFDYMIITNNELRVLRPYQLHAIENILKLVKQDKKNGYIWHTTGSGKTLTSFKASELILENPNTNKLLFVVDRLDLDDQTLSEFENFSKYKNEILKVKTTKELIKKLKSNAIEDRFIVVTIHKLSKAMPKLKENDILNKKTVIMFDECQRSNYGNMMKVIKDGFTNANLIGFTGTPILASNPIDGFKTTASVFEKQLHSYRIDSAIRDKNVLPFQIEYFNTLKLSDKFKDRKINGNLNEKEVLADDKRANMIANFIVANHNIKTNNKKYSGMFAVDSIAMAKKYYNFLNKEAKEQNIDLNISTIFSCQDNNDAEDKIGKEILQEIINDHNKKYNTVFNLKDKNGFDSYRKDVASKTKNGTINILIVVDMFLVGFDAPIVNTLYVDKSLKYHSLIQAFSRTNRVETGKNFGRIVCFRNLKDQADTAVSLYSTDHKNQTVFLDSYENYVKYFNKEAEVLINSIPNPSLIDSDNLSEEVKKTFIKQFKKLNKTLKFLKSFSNFDYQDLVMNEDLIEEFREKYLYAYNNRETYFEEITRNEIDFQIEEVNRDFVNVDYIKNLLFKLNLTLPSENKKEDLKKIKDEIMKKVSETLGLSTNLKELLTNFIKKINLENVERDRLVDKFYDFWRKEEEESLNFILKKYKEIDKKELNNYYKEMSNSNSLREHIDSELLSLIEPIKFDQKNDAKKLIQSTINELLIMRELF